MSKQNHGNADAQISCFCCNDNCMITGHFLEQSCHSSSHTHGEPIFTEHFTFAVDSRLKVWVWNIHATVAGLRRFQQSIIHSLPQQTSKFLKNMVQSRRFHCNLWIKKCINILLTCAKTFLHKKVFPNIVAPKTTLVSISFMKNMPSGLSMTRSSSNSSLLNLELPKKRNQKISHMVGWTCRSCCNWRASIKA